MYFSGNKLTCDCHLTWIQVLRNDTKSDPLRTAIDDVTCIPKPIDRVDTTKTANPELYTDETKTEHFYEIETNSEVFQQVGNDEEYDDPNKYKQETTTQSIITNQLSIVSVPPELLLCSNELVENAEDSLMLSSKHESYWRPNLSNKLLSNLSLMVILIVILQTTF